MKTAFIFTFLTLVAIVTVGTLTFHVFQPRYTNTSVHTRVHVTRGSCILGHVVDFMGLRHWRIDQ